FGDHVQQVQYLAVSPDGKRAVSAAGHHGPDGRDFAPRIWDLETEQLIRRLDKHTGVVTGLAFSPDGQRIASASHDKSLRLWDAETGQEVRCFDEGKTAYLTVDFSRDGKRLLT